MNIKRTVILVASLVLLSNFAASVGPRCPSVSPDILQADYDGNQGEIKLAVQSDADATYKVIFYDSSHDVLEMKTFDKTSGIHEKNFELNDAPAKISIIPEDCSFTASSTTDIRYKGVYEEPKLEYGDGSESDEKVTRLEDRLTEKNETIENLENELEEKQDRLDQLLKNYNDVQSELANQSEERVEEDSNRMATLEKTVLELNNTLEQKNQKISELKSDLDTKIQRISDLEEQIEDTNSTDSTDNETRQENQGRSDEERKSLVDSIISSLF